MTRRLLTAALALTAARLAWAALRCGEDCERCRWDRRERI